MELEVAALERRIEGRPHRRDAVRVGGDQPMQRRRDDRAARRDLAHRGRRLLVHVDDPHPQPARLRETQEAVVSTMVAVRHETDVPLQRGAAQVPRREDARITERDFGRCADQLAGEGTPDSERMRVGAGDARGRG